ncbi:TetR/AcrR family transcriptional regulator [Enterococcus sp. AZ103]|uniref:TetR/AcrR family transcriptional regulator n=1 Tax=Enterococcus sp. AZ103 TaxID=2774628 RepID=UPI003F29AAF0
MPRGRNPEETKRKILAVAEGLFLEKGYDNTSIQDIVDGLGGMTKGVIYHHFKSKFDILQQIVEVNAPDPAEHIWIGENGLEKLQNAFKEAFTNFRRQELAYSGAIIVRSPRLLGEQYLEMFEFSVPRLKEMVDEGVADGSIVTDFPEELAELIVLTLNVWVGFQMFTLSKEELKRKLAFIKLTFDGLGVPIISDELLMTTYDLFDYLKKND